MRKLLDGYRRFHSHVFPQKRRLYASLADKQSPRYLFITCDDSRVDPLEFTGTVAGDMFMERSIGNLVPEPGHGEHEAGAAIEYAVVALHVEHIILCGHSGCGAMRALLDPESARAMPTVSAASWPCPRRIRTSAERREIDLQSDTEEHREKRQ